MNTKQKNQLNSLLNNQSKIEKIMYKNSYERRLIHKFAEKYNLTHETKESKNIQKILVPHARNYIDFCESKSNDSPYYDREIHRIYSNQNNYTTRLYKYVQVSNELTLIHLLIKHLQKDIVFVILKLLS